MNFKHAFLSHVVVSIITVYSHSSSESTSWNNILAEDEGLTNSLKSHVVSKLSWVGISSPADIDVQYHGRGNSYGPVLIGGGILRDVEPLGSKSWVFEVWVVGSVFTKGFVSTVAAFVVIVALTLPIYTSNTMTFSFKAVVQHFDLHTSSTAWKLFAYKLTMADEVVKVALGCWIVVSWNEVATLWYNDESKEVEVLPISTDSC